MSKETLHTNVEHQCLALVNHSWRRMIHEWTVLPLCHVGLTCSLKCAHCNVKVIALYV